MLTINSVDYDDKSAEFENILVGDDIKLDFTAIKTETLESEIDGDVATTTIKLSNFKLAGEDASNYEISEETQDYTYTVEKIISEGIVLGDQDVSVDAAPSAGNENGILITDIVASEPVESLVVDAKDIATATGSGIINAVSFIKDAFANIINSVSEALEITLNDSDDATDPKEATVSFNKNALETINNNLLSDATELSVIVDKPEDHELEIEQAGSKDTLNDNLENSTVYTFEVVDNKGKKLLSEQLTEEGVEIKVTVPYEKPEGANKRVVVNHIADNGDVTTINDAVYDSVNKTITMILKHFSVYHIGTQTYSSGSSSSINVGILLRHAVTFNSNGGSDVAGQLVKRGGYVTEPEDPTREGYEFDGWYIDEDLTEEFDFDSKVTGRLTLYASWIETDEETDEEVIEETEVKEMIFTDVSEDAWYFDAVEFVYGKGITNGVSETEFAPNGKVTRGQFITMLCRAYGIEEMDGDNFADCGDTWYTGYLAAAKQLGIANGVGDNMFAPDRFVTREEMVTLLYNYYKSQDMVGEEATETSFADDADVSAWAKAAVAYASEEGIINGKGDNMFDPRGNATRAELAQIFYNIFAWGE